MDFCDLSEEYLSDAMKYCSYDEKIPFVYRVIGKLISEYKYEKAMEIIESNGVRFDEDYGYLILDMAIEYCVDIVMSLDGQELDKKHSLDGLKGVRPTKKTFNFIKWLLDKGAKPDMPKDFNQFDHLAEIQDDGRVYENCEFDFSELNALLESYM